VGATLQSCSFVTLSGVEGAQGELHMWALRLRSECRTYELDQRIELFNAAVLPHTTLTSRSIVLSCAERHQTIKGERKGFGQLPFALTSYASRCPSFDPAFLGRTGLLPMSVAPPPPDEKSQLPEYDVPPYAGPEDVGSGTTDRLALDEVRVSMSRIIAAWGFGATFVTLTGGAVYTAFARKLGASDFEFGVLAAALPMMSFLQVLAARVVEKSGRRKRQMVIPNLISRMLWVVAALIPLFSELYPGTIGKRVVLYSVMSCLILAGAAGSLGSPAFFAWLGELVPQRVRPTFLAKRVQVGTWVALIAALAGGWLADHFSSLSAYSIILALAGVAGVIDILFFLTVHVPPRTVPHPDKLPPLWQSLKEPLRDRPVRIFLIYNGVFMFSAGLFGPFTWLHSMERLGFSKTMTNLILLVAPLLAVAVSTRFWAEVIKRHGNRPVIRLSAVSLAIVPLIWFLAHDISEGPWMSWGMLLIMTFSVAAVASGFDLANANLMMRLSPHLPRPTVSALTFIASGMSYAAGTWSGGALAEWLGDKPYQLFDFGMTNYHVLFLCALVVRLINAAFIAPLLDEPTANTTRETAKDIIPDFALSLGARLIRTFRTEAREE